MVVVMGVSGAGKTTVARGLGALLGWDVADADDLHSPAAIATMRGGQPVTDEQRRPWLDRVAVWIDGHLDAGSPGLVSCSALRRSHRDVLRRDRVTFVHLVADRAELRGRLSRRRDHFMPADLLDSQLATLEPPGPDERAVTVDSRTAPAELARLLGLGPC